MQKELQLEPLKESHGELPLKGMFLKLLLTRAHGSFSPTYLKLLPQDNQIYDEALLRSHDYFKNPTSLLFLDEERLSKVHYSWFFEPLKQFSKLKREEIISTLSENQRLGLEKLFKEKMRVNPSPFSYHLKKQLFKAIGLEEHLTVDQLPRSSKNILLSLEKQDLIQVIDYLSLFDLGVELKTVIAKEQLKSIFNSLSTDKQAFLKTCMQKKDRFTTSKFDLSKINLEISKDALFRRLHLFGLLRLTSAVSIEHESFIWHLAHLLDISRGSKLLELASQTKTEHIARIASAQLETVIQHLFQGNKA